MRFLIIQTASIGDVILSTPLIEKLRRFFPDAKIDFLTKKGNESLFASHPFLDEILLWNKKKSKPKELLRLLKVIRQKHYDYVFNLQRFAATGLLTAFSGAPNRIGFDKNPLSCFFTHKVRHDIGGRNLHEIDRNLKLLESITDSTRIKPRLYPSESDFDKVKDYKYTGYYCVAPASLWFTKQLPEALWATFLKNIVNGQNVYLLGSKNDVELCERLRKDSGNANVINLAGKLDLLQSAALMKDAKMNFVNDSSPMHLASAMNAPTTAVFCSTVPEFGFGPLSDDSVLVETQEKLTCRPCGIHGHAACPKGHFKCGYNIDLKQIISRL
jgi:ADP-heptose:LPS heptosyltransferase